MRVTTLYPPDYQTPERMALKRQSIPFPDFVGKSVLDVGTDHGYWAFHAAENGAVKVVGIDRNRLVKGRGFCDLISQNKEAAKRHPLGSVVEFHHTEVGRQWVEFGKFDVALVMSVYHHIYECAGGDHLPIWFWLWRQLNAGGVVIWEGPVDTTDSVVKRNVSQDYHADYSKKALVDAASVYFDAEYIGPALHEPTREVWRFTRRNVNRKRMKGTVESGAGGASEAFAYADGRRVKEINAILGFEPHPGSLNLRTDRSFDWSRGYYRAQMLDVEKRSQGLDSKWSPKWARLYPVEMDGGEPFVTAFAFRFEGERYPQNFVELIAPQRLRDGLTSEEVTLCQ